MLEPRFIAMMQGRNLRSVRLEDSMSCTLEVCRRHTWRHGWMAQGDFYAGISLGYDLRLFLPLNISAFEVKDNKLKDWCKSWMGSDYSPPLEPEDWFGKGHKPSVHIWSQPPAAVLVSMKQLARSFV